MRVFSQLVRFGLCFLALWFADGLSLWATSALLPGFTLQGAGDTPKLVVAFAAAFLLGIVNLLIRPLILLLARPLGFIALFIIGFFVNAIALYITAWLLPGFTISSIFAAILGGLLFSAVNMVLTGILEIDDEGSFYQSYIERTARKRGFKGPDIHRDRCAGAVGHRAAIGHSEPAEGRTMPKAHPMCVRQGNRI
jgi:putative membrane protein